MCYILNCPILIVSKKKKELEDQKNKPIKALYHQKGTFICYCNSTGYT